MIDRNTISRRGNGTPATGAFAITPHDTNNLPFVTRGIYVGSEGNVRVQLLDGDPVTFTGAQVGSILPIQAVRVFATGTTASNLIGLD